MKKLINTIFTIAIIYICIQMLGLAVAQEAQEKPKTDTSNKLYVDDTAEILAKDDLEELKRRGVSLEEDRPSWGEYIKGSVNNEKM